MGSCISSVLAGVFSLEEEYIGFSFSLCSVFLVVWVCDWGSRL